jgi:hypothetical protein
MQLIEANEILSEYVEVGAYGELTIDQKGFEEIQRAQQNRFLTTTNASIAAS